MPKGVEGRALTQHSTPCKALRRPQVTFVNLSLYASMTTAQSNFANVYDVSNTCIFRLYANLGLDRPGAKSGVLHIDETVLQVDRKVEEETCGRSFYDKVLGRPPRQLHAIWGEASFELFDRSTVNPLLSCPRVWADRSVLAKQTRPAL